MQLHDFRLSGNCYKVRLFLALLGREVELLQTDLLGGAQKRAEFLALNPRGQVPVLVDEGQAIYDSQAILVYLAKRYGAPSWYPQDALSQARIASWLSFAANEVAQGPGQARLHGLFRMPGDLQQAQQRAVQVLDLLDAHLAQHTWLAQGEAPSIADLAVYPYIALAGDGGIDLAPYVHLAAWFARIRALPGHIGMPGL
ncbi:glutathione S-transferase family protein [Pseudomonas sp. SO81]|uniref:glutathione S-transferase family protein n=1 Tax=Pseudomonas sp. SO81 TaxID=2983246 RepID=UPI0025A386B9|nr:glutathione S-transferase family protein [Pseudomonas sp. SO81]WJN57697.1 Glutathione S-transferase, unnamed subgroup [Pseudomonas sp. SO81]